MNGFNGFSLKEKLSNIWNNYRKYIIIISIVVLVMLITLIIVLNSSKNNKQKYAYELVESIMVYNAKEYIKNNEITKDMYISLNYLNIEIDSNLKCNSNSGVLVEDNSYTPYLMCEGYNSQVVANVIKENEENSKYGVLLGDNPYIVTDTYQELGISLVEGYTVNIKDSNIDNGINKVTYNILESGSYVTHIDRIVIAEGILGSAPVIELVGNQTRTLEINTQYIESGYTATDKIDGNITDKVKVDGNVDVTKAGTYTLTYSVTNTRGKSASVKRKVIVNDNSINLDITHTISPTEVTSTGVKITLDIKGAGYSYTITDNGEKVTSKNPTYTAYKNGTYEFTIYDTNDNSEVYSVEIKNIDANPPTGTCSAIYKNGATIVTVVASDASGIKQYEYINNNKTLFISSNKTYSFGEYPQDLIVKVVDNQGYVSEFKCSVDDYAPLEIHFINLGRNDGILLRGSNTTIFIDGGLYYFSLTSAEYMRSLGITKIDALIGSHLDDNHIHAQKRFLEEFEVKGVYYGDDPRTCALRKTCDISRANPSSVVEAIDSKKVPITILKEGESVKIGNLTFDVVGPITLTGSVNVNSLNLILKYGDVKIFFAGDGIQEKEILNKYNTSILDVDVLKYPHHGQATISDAFLDALTPKFVMVTHVENDIPASVQKKLKSLGATTYITAKNGNMVLTVDGKNVDVKTNVNPANYKK